MEVYIMKNLLLLVILLFISRLSIADTVNPCEYMNMQIYNEQSLDVGNDPNFIRIMEHNNQQLILECQQYQIDKLRRLQHQEQSYDRYYTPR